MNLVMPNEFHPDYQGREFLRDWINDSSSHHLLTVELEDSLAVYEQPPSDYAESTLSTKTQLLSKRKAWGEAPYVGKPYRYVWPVATDGQGRSIAGEAYAVFDPNDARVFYKHPYYLPLIDPITGERLQ